MSRLARALLAATGLAVLVVLVGMAVGGGKVVEAAKDKRPNVLVIMADDQFTTTIKNMPYVSSRNDWAQFSNAIVNTSLCCPSRATFLTGQTSSHNGIESNSETEDFKGASTIGDWLDDAGYQTGYVGKYMNKFPWTEPDNYIPSGWDWWAGYTGKQTYFNFNLNQNGEIVEYRGQKQYSIDVLTDRMVDFINGVSEDKPFFSFLSYNSPHSPATPPKRYQDADVKPIARTPAFLERDISDKPQWIRHAGDPNRRKQLAKRLQHNRALLAMDDSVEEVFEALQARGLLENTIVLYTSDHGISLGEHQYTKKTCGYEVCSRVPLLVRGPGVVPGVVEGLVGNVDFAPTITDYAGIKTGAPVDGRSIRPLLERKKRSLHKAVLMRRAQGKGERIFWGVRTLRWKYLHYTRTGERELYDLKRDPYELENLLAKGNTRARWERKGDELERRLQTMRKTKPKVRK